ncbi:glycosyltransferase [Sphaerisporangium sp. TRM90804]|uniref:glycosyltransferase n=1 Tax=Sphaerisporangium sp. TRM90804 TaxID=3031113 RepID=UPI00244B3BF6|nr:glycosyltransferase [Sphaerisporangium sp. TRM90804]MDH2429224.1 glycosyltransferase [Sphaerisporangium sp. TRM90804]
MRLVFLVPSAYGMRGDTRAVLNLATELASRHEVEIVSVRRVREAPFFPVDPAISLRWLVDARPGVRHLLPPGQMRTEMALWRTLRSMRCDVLVTTRPGLSVQAVRHVPRDTVRIAREWSRPAVPGPVRRFYPKLDAVVASTETAGEEYTRFLDGGGPPVHVIPDALAPEPWPRSRMDNRVVSAGGRWLPGKAFDVLIQAFAVVADKRPDWRLRLYGGGPEEKRLRALVGRLSLHNNVYFMGTTPDLPGEFAKASIVAVTSHAETPGMTVIEALGCGVPVVGFEGSRGPGEYVTAGRDSVLVPRGEGEVEAFAAALLALIDDERRRVVLGAGARESAAGHAAPAVAGRWEELVAALRPR